MAHHPDRAFPSNRLFFQLEAPLKVECVPTKWTARGVRTLEPSEQTRPVEKILTNSAPFRRQLLIGTDHTVADGALALSLQCPGHVFPPRYESIDDRAACGREVDDSLDRYEPTPPFLLVDAHAVQALNRNGMQGVCRRKTDGDGHCLVVNRVACDDLPGFRGDFDFKNLVFRVLGRDPGCDSGKLGLDNVRRNLQRRT